MQFPVKESWQIITYYKTLNRPHEIFLSSSKWLKKLLGEPISIDNNRNPTMKRKNWFCSNVQAIISITSKGP